MTSGILGDALTKEVLELIESKLDEHEKLTHDELKEIAASLVPDLNDLVSKQVKKHFIILAQYALETFGGNLEDA